MTELKSGRAHLIAGGFPPGAHAGHDHDYSRRRLLGLLAEQGVPASVANDFADVERWLPVSQLLITYVAGPYPDTTQCHAIERWLQAGGRWLGLHGTSGGRAERVEGVRQRRTLKTEHHALLGSYFLIHPRICKIRVEVRGDDRLTQGLGSSFDVEDEPYFIEIQDPASTRILLSADYGPHALSPTIGPSTAPTRRYSPTAEAACWATPARSATVPSPTLPSVTATTRPSAPAARSIPRIPRPSPFVARGKPTPSSRCWATASPGGWGPDGWRDPMTNAARRVAALDRSTR
jgi:type 1 glutamine amidotransferase